MRERSAASTVQALGRDVTGIAQRRKTAEIEHERQSYWSKGRWRAAERDRNR
jgi:hypothetical protein